MIESARNHLAGVIESIVPEGALVRVTLDCGVPIVALVTLPAREELGLRIGDRCTAVIKATSVHLVSRVGSTL